MASGFQTPITVIDAMVNINNRKYLIPSFQREYVWDAVRVENLFDSLMRGYPINSMLFWQVTQESYNSFDFYDFLSEYIEHYNVHNVRTNVTNDFYAILDGQQRLTSLYLGLYGTYAYHTKYHGWDKSEDNFPKRRLYLNLSRINSNATEDDKKYNFVFLRDSDTKKQDIYIKNEDKWFRVGKITEMKDKLRQFSRENNLSDYEDDILNRLFDVVWRIQNINYYLETSVEPNQAVNVFVRTNAGGKPLSILDIILSLTIAGWKKTNAKEEFIQLGNRVEELGFHINHDYILKSFLCLLHKSVKNQISSFDTDFLTLTEQNWPIVREAIYRLFELVKSYGLDGETLKSYNATLPILYYLYKKNITNFLSITHSEDRDIVRKWLLRTLLYGSFSSSADTVLQNALNVISNNIGGKVFPAKEISQTIGQPSTADEVWINSLLDTQKDNAYAFPILSLLYPSCNFAIMNFDRDHLHPKYMFDEYKKSGGIYEWKQYNSIVNLQLLDQAENRSKKAESLEDWVKRTLPKRSNLYDETYIPNKVGLTIVDFDTFYVERKKLLAEALQKIIGN